MPNLGTVIAFEFWRTIKKKSFWVSVLAFPALVGLVAGVAYFSSRAADKATQKINSERFSLMVEDQSGLLRPEIIRGMGASLTTDREGAISDVEHGLVDAFFYYPKNLKSQSVEIYAKDVGLIKNGKYQAVALQLLKSSQALVLSPQQLAVAQGAISTSVTTYENGKQVPGIERVVAPGAILVLFYITFVLMAGRMLASTTEEKENRVIEMLLATVHSRTLIIGKVLSLLLIGVVQVVTVGVLVGLIVYFGRNYIHIPSIDLSKVVFDPATLMISILIFAFAYLLFTGILVAVGSAVPTAKEAGSFMGVTMLAMFVPLYAAQAIVTDPNQLVVKIFSVVPLTSPITLLLRNAVGNLGWQEALLGILILAGSAIVALWVAARAFGYGTMEYNRKLGLREVIGLVSRG